MSTDTHTPAPPATYPPFPQAGLRVEATWSAQDAGIPESVVVEINDKPITGDLVTHVVMALFTAGGDVKPALIAAELVDSQPATEGGTAR
jgi:hypothetical protein